MVGDAKVHEGPEKTCCEDSDREEAIHTSCPDEVHGLPREQTVWLLCVAELSCPTPEVCEEGEMEGLPVSDQVLFIERTSLRRMETRIRQGRLD